MKINNLLKLLNRRKRSAGFTLTELLLAASLTTVVVGGAGFGLVTMTDNHKTASAKVERRTEINRASEFISSEIRKAVNIESNPTTAFNEISSNIDADSKNGAEAVLALNVPGIDKPIIYYVANSNSTWIGPKVIYRYGPKFEDDGQYNTGTWLAEPLVDHIYSTSQASCNGGETQTGTAGFAACINSTGTMARLYINGEIEKNTGEQYQSNTQTFARANDSLTIAAAPGAFTSTKLLNFTLSGNTPIINGDNNKLSLIALGQNLSNGNGNGNNTLSINAALMVNGQSVSTLDSSNSSQNNISVASGDQIALEVSIDSPGNSYGSVSSDDTSSTKVYALVNDDYLPDGFDETNIPSFLADYISNGQVVIDEDQILYVFELNGNSSASNNYNLQDYAVLMTVSQNSSGSGNSNNTPNYGNSGKDDADDSTSTDDTTTAGTEEYGSESTDGTTTAGTDSGVTGSTTDSTTSTTGSTTTTSNTTASNLLTGRRVKSNNGHGNNCDGYDTSNQGNGGPSNANHQETDASVDDECTGGSFKK